MSRILLPQCGWCKHFHSHKAFSMENKTCEAFPEGIPEDIYENYFDHRVPYQYGDDHGIQFEEQTNFEAFPEFYRKLLSNETLRKAIFSGIENAVKSLKGKKYRPDPGLAP
jgi:hypothetical protein